MPRVWGATPDELAATYPCDRLAPGAAECWFRAVTVAAARPVTSRWLCQLKVAPYSYDLLDNYGRRSPRKLTPGAGQLAIGQPVMTIFELVDFAEDEHLTMRMRSAVGVRLFGEFTITYAVRDHGPGETRLVAKLLVGSRDGAGVADTARRKALAWGDLFMMRRQLKTLGQLAGGEPSRR